jgi:hypothetical protein
VSNRHVVHLVVLVACCAAIAGCGGGGGKSSSSSSLEAALGVKQVAGLFTGGLNGVIAPVCDPAAVTGNYNCTAQPILGPCTASTQGPCASPLAPTKIWFDCFPDKGGADQWSCQLVSPPAGTSVFTTKAQKAAPKHAVWICQAYNANHERVGPLWIATNDPHGPMQQHGESMTIEAAAVLAKQLGLKLTNGC